MARFGRVRSGVVALAVAFVLTGIPLAITTPDGDMTRYGVLVPAGGGAGALPAPAGRLPAPPAAAARVPA